jgi:hypothetical protein
MNNKKSRDDLIATHTALAGVNFKRPRGAFWQPIASAAALLPFLAVVGGAQVGNYETSWVGNTFAGTPNMLHVQLNIDGLFVASDGHCYTTSSWDEGGRTDSIYQNGGLTTPPDFCGDLNSDQVVTDGTYIYYAGWNGVSRYTMGGSSVDHFGSGIVNGLALANGQIYVSETSNNVVQIYSTSTMNLVSSFSAPSPARIAVDPNGGIWVAHFRKYDRATGTIDCYNSSGTNLNSITLPNQGDAAALAIDNLGRLMVCDNGPDLNVKIYTNLTANPPTLAATFGVTGGTLAGPTNGLGGPLRFSAMTGVGADANGNIYLSQNGSGPGYLPGGDIGNGAVLESYQPNGVRNWIVQGLEYASLVDVDPDSETDAYDLSHHFTINYAKTIAGTECSYRSCTYNQFKYPNDTRYRHDLSVVNSLYARRIQGKLFLFMSNQAGSFYEIYRFNPATDGDTAIPCGGFSYGGSNGYINVDNAPVSGEWIWYDSNADGNPETNEFSQPPKATHIDNQWWWTDTSGDVWQSRGEGPAIGHYAFQGLDTNGIPKYDWNHFTALAAPPGFSGVDKIIYFPTNDTMYLMGNSLSQVACYHNWSTGNRTAAWSVPIPNSGPSTESPEGMAVAGNYVFINYYVPHQVLVYNTADGSSAGTILPGPEVGGPGAVGNVDCPMCINARQRANGEYLIFGEEDWQAKVLMYRWNPTACVVQAAPGNGDVALSWSAVPGALSYNVYRGTAPGGEGNTPLASSITQTNYLDTQVSAGIHYYYEVTAVTSSGLIGPSMEVGATPTSAGTPVLQIACGSSANIIDTSWVADIGTGGWTSATGVPEASINTSQVVNPAPLAVYENVRGGNSSYTIPGLATNTMYTVRLHFMEYWWNAPGIREFNVSINGTLVLQNFDIFAAAGGQDIVLVKEFRTLANSGSINITFTTTMDNALIFGIEVLMTPPTPPQFTANTVLANGAFQMEFVNTNPVSFTVLSSTNLSLPISNWRALGTPISLGGNSYQFTDAAATNLPERYYRLSWH